MKRHWMIVLTAMFVVALVTSSAWVQVTADGQRPGRGAGRGQGLMMGADRPALADYTRGLEGLTDKQKKEIAEIRSEALKKVAQIEEQMNAKIKTVLTPEQAKAMAEAQRRVTHRGPGGVIMTDEQKKIVDAAREEAAKADSPEESRQIMRDAYQKVRESYTEEQRKQAEASRVPGSRGQGRGQGRQRPGQLDPVTPAPAEEQE